MLSKLSPTLLSWGVVTAMGIIFALVGWGVEVVEHAIKRNAAAIEHNADDVRKLEKEVRDLSNETREMETKLEFVLDERKKK